MSRGILLGILLSLFACSQTKQSTKLARKGGDRALFVGHTPNGEVVVAAQHYAAMNGMAVTADEIDATSTEDGSLLLCKREVVTGSHYPQWICRYKEEHERVSELDRERARAFWQALPTTCTDCATH